MVQNSPRGEVPLTDKVTRARSRQERSGGHRGHPPYPCERLPYSSPPDTPTYTVSVYIIYIYVCVCVCVYIYIYIYIANPREEYIFLNLTLRALSKNWLLGQSNYIREKVVIISNPTWRGGRVRTNLSRTLRRMSASRSGRQARRRSSRELGGNAAASWTAEWSALLRRPARGTTSVNTFTASPLGRCP